MAVQLYALKTAVSLWDRRVGCEGCAWGGVGGCARAPKTNRYGNSYPLKIHEIRQAQIEKCI